MIERSEREEGVIDIRDTRRERGWGVEEGCD